MTTITSVRYDASIDDRVVEVEPYRTLDRDGRTVEVYRFYGNGPFIGVEGCRVKRDGTSYVQGQVLNVAVPADVREALGR